MSTKTRKLQIWWMDDEPDRLKNFPKDAIQKPSHAPKRQAELTMVDLKAHNSIGAVLKLLDEAKKKEAVARSRSY